MVINIPANTTLIHIKEQTIREDINFIFATIEFLSLNQKLDSANAIVKSVIKIIKEYKEINNVPKFLNINSTKKTISSEINLSKEVSYFQFTMDGINNFNNSIHELNNDMNNFNKILSHILIETKNSSDLQKNDENEKSISIFEERLFSEYKYLYSKYLNYTESIEIIYNRLYNLNGLVLNSIKLKKINDNVLIDEYIILEREYFYVIERLKTKILKTFKLPNIISNNRELKLEINKLKNEIQEIDDFNKNTESINFSTKIDNYYIKLDENMKIAHQNMYVNFLNVMELPNFEKIRRYSNNLLNDNRADDMQKYLSENGKMQKALIYDSLEQFIERFNGKNITIIDWGCNQGIASMLVIDYIKEKQLNINVDIVVLIDDEEKALSRAMIHLKTLKKDNLDLIIINSKNDKSIKQLNKIKNQITLNLFVNDKMPIDFSSINHEIFFKAYVMCLSNNNQKFVLDIFRKISLNLTIENIIERSDRIGKYKRFEKIFQCHEIPF